MLAGMQELQDSTQEKLQQAPHVLQMLAGLHLCMQTLNKAHIVPVKVRLDKLPTTHLATLA
jgi:hypothetical protein